MRTLPTGTNIISPRGRCRRLLWAFWHQWGVLWDYWRAAWLGRWPDEPSPASTPPTKKQQRKMAKEYDRASK